MTENDNEDDVTPRIKTSVRLPNVASDLIELALRDLKRAEEDPGYEVNMHEWHRPSRGMPGRCIVCMAGAVMAGTLGVSPSLDVVPDMIDDAETRDRLRALNEFRLGRVGSGLRAMRLEVRSPDVLVPMYEEDQQGFKEAMREMARGLRAAGA